MVKPLNKQAMYYCSVNKTVTRCAILLLALILQEPAQAQMSKKEMKKTLRNANADYEENNYGPAWMFYRQVISADPNNAKAGSKAAFCAVKLNYPVDSLRQISPTLEKSKETDAPYYLAIIRHQEKKFDDALRLIGDYQKIPAGRRMFTDTETGQVTAWSTNAKKFHANPSPATIRNMGPSLNSKYADYVPVIMPDESALYFTSRRENSAHPARNGDGTFYEDVYVSYNRDGKWSAAENIGIPVNSETNDACVAISPDGQRMIVYRTSAENIATGDLYICALGKGGRWQPLQKMTEKINSPHIETSACFSNDTAEIFFSSDRPGGLGGKDLYRIRKLPNGQWSEPMNLGPRVNTNLDDDAPFLHPDGVTLYFSSKGHSSMGDFDVFKSKWDRESSQFSQAENLGYPINDVGNDIFFVLSVDGQRGYYTTTRADDHGGTDLYEIDTRFAGNDLQVRTGKIVLGNSYGRARITVTEKESGELNGYYLSNPDSGKFILALNPHKSYEAEIEAEGFTTQKYSVTPASFGTEKELSIILTRPSAP